MVTMHEVDSARPLRWHSGADWCATRIFEDMKTSRQTRYLPDIDSIARYLGCEPTDGAAVNAPARMSDMALGAEQGRLHTGQTRRLADRARKGSRMTRQEVGQ